LIWIKESPSRLPDTLGPRNPFNTAMKPVRFRIALAVFALGLAATPLVHATGSAEAIFQASFRALDGSAASLAEHRGKVLIVNFWASWCPPCRTEIPELAAVHGRYRERGVTVIGIAADDSEVVRTLVALYGVNYPVVQDYAQAVALMQGFGNSKTTLPFTVIVDRDGQVVKSKRGAVDAAWLEAVLDELLATRAVAR
jgi:thiol-disulfide isomerase/thioredoxin